MATATKSRSTTETKPRTKSQIYGDIADETGLSRKEVGSVFESLSKIIRKDLSKRGPGVVNVAGLMKIMIKKIPARPSRQGINPFTGEPTTFKAKPARNVVKVRPLKSLKDMA